MSDSAADRDSCVDPRIRDLVTKGAAARTVEYVTVLGDVIYTQNNRRGEHTCTLDAWRKWCKGGVTERAAPEFEPSKMSVNVGHDMIRELARLRSQVGDVGGAYFSEGAILVTLAELALAAIYRPDHKIGVNEKALAEILVRKFK